MTNQNDGSQTGEQIINDVAIDSQTMQEFSDMANEANQDFSNLPPLGPSSSEIGQQIQQETTIQIEPNFTETQNPKDRRYRPVILGELTICHDITIFRPEIIELFQKFIHTINRPIVLVDWFNSNVSNYIRSINHQNAPFIFCLPLIHQSEQIKASQINIKYADYMLPTLSINSYRKTFDKAYTDYDEQIYKQLPEIKPNPTNNILVLTENAETEKIGWNNNIVCALYLDIFSTFANIFDSKMVLTTFVFPAIENYLKNGIVSQDSGKETEEAINEKARKSYSIFNKFAQSGFQQTLNNLRNETNNAQREVIRYYEGIQAREKDIQQNSILLRSLSKRKTNYFSDFESKAVEYLKALHKKYKSFTVNGNGIIEGVTYPIEASFDGKTYELGEFLVMVDMKGTVTIDNLTKTREDIYQHPHIREQLPCLGNLKETIPQMIFQFDLLGVFDIMHNFLSSYNHEGPYLRIYYWGDSEVCNNCGEPSEGCDCHRCDECNEIMDNCECSRCGRCDSISEYCECERCGECEALIDDCECAE